MPKIKDETVKKRRLAEYEEIFQDIPENKSRLVNKMVAMAVDMESHLQNLEIELQKTGFIEQYQNGEHQFGTKESTASRSYSTMVKNYTGVIRTLLSCLPEEKQKPAEDSLGDFLRSRK